MRRKLTDILGEAESQDLRTRWDNAPTSSIIPAGIYKARSTGGRLDKSRNGTPRFSVTFEFVEGPYLGRLIWLDFYLTDGAIERSKRDLVKLGYASPDAFEGPAPAPRVCEIKVVHDRFDEAAEPRPRITTLRVFHVEQPQVDPYAPTDDERHSIESKSSDPEEGTSS